MPTKTKTKKAAALQTDVAANGTINYQSILGYIRKGFIDFTEITEEGEVMLTDSETGETFAVCYSVDEDCFIEPKTPELA